MKKRDSRTIEDGGGESEKGCAMTLFAVITVFNPVSSVYSQVHSFESNNY